MKIKTLLAATGLAAASVTGVAANPAAAGCGVSIEVHNTGNSTLTVDWNDSDSRTSTVVLGNRIAGTWRRIDTYSTNISAGSSITRAFTMDLGCNIDRQYRIEVSRGGSTWFEYFPGPGVGGWNRDLSPDVYA